jgi:hypothetical protein
LHEKTSNHLKYHGEKPHTMAGGSNFILTADTVAHYVPPGTGCTPGAPPHSPLGSLPAADGKSTEFTHSIGRRSIINCKAYQK